LDFSWLRIEEKKFEIFFSLNEENKNNNDKFDNQRFIFEFNHLEKRKEAMSRNLIKII
jgi:hypothetical protein